MDQFSLDFLEIDSLYDRGHRTYLIEKNAAGTGEECEDEDDDEATTEWEDDDPVSHTCSAQQTNLCRVSLP